MSETKEKIVSLQSDAEKLVNNLEELSKQITVYKTVNQQIEEICSTLIEFVESTKELTVKSHQIIEGLNNIDGTEIIFKLNSLANANTESVSQISELIKSSNKVTINNIVELKDYINLENQQTTMKLDSLVNDNIKSFSQITEMIINSDNRLAQNIIDVKEHINLENQQTKIKIDDVNLAIQNSQKFNEKIFMYLKMGIGAISALILVAILVSIFIK